MLQKINIFPKILVIVIFLSLFFGLPIYFLFWEYSEAKKAKESMNWPTTDGIIISSDIEEEKDPDTDKMYYSPKILYSYSVERIKYSSTKIYFGEHNLSIENVRAIVNQYPAGKHVMVYYNPDKHNLSVLMPGGKTTNSVRLWGPFLFICIGVFILVQDLIFHPRKEKKIAKTFRQASLRLGMEYIEKIQSLKNEDFSEFPLFHKGFEIEADPPRIRNVVRGQQDGIKKMIFRYIYSTGTGDDRQDHEELVAVISTLESNLPRFEMYPKKLGDKIGEIFGKKHDIKFQSYREFSNNYLLHCFREQAIRKLFDSEILNFFSKERGWSIEGGGDWLVIFKATSIDLDTVLNLEKNATLISRLLSK